MAAPQVEERAEALAIVVPMLDEAATLPALLVHLAGWRARGCEVVLVDGGSRDDSVAMARAAGLRVVVAERGRARQMNAGAQACGRALMLFLHADTRLPEAADAMVCAALAVQAWGRFDVHIDGRPRMLRVVAALMNLRSRLSGIATGVSTRKGSSGGRQRCRAMPAIVPRTVAIVLETMAISSPEPR